MGDVVMYALAVSLMCLGLANTAIVPRVLSPPDNQNVLHSALSHVPEGKAFVYKYSASVTAGQSEPTAHASRFQIDGLLVQATEKLGQESDPKSTATRLSFRDVEHTVYNGPDDGTTGEFRPNQDTIKDFAEPFLVVHNRDRILGIKVQKEEANWSQNMKKSLASLVWMPYVSLDEIKNSTLINQTTEETIHGICQVDYQIYRKEEVDGYPSVFVVRKTYDPLSCSRYAKQIVSNNQNLECSIEKEEDLVTAVEKIYEFEFVDNVQVHIKRIISHEKLSYLPWSHRNFGIQFIETNQTIEFEKVINETELKQIPVNFDKVPMTSSIIFDVNNYVPDVNFSENHYFKRVGVKNSEHFKAETIDLLISMMDYLKENQINLDQKNLKYKNLLGKLYHSMQYLDSESMNAICEHFNVESEKTIIARKIFLKLIPQLGTFAAWNFTMNIITNKKYEDDIKIDMLTNLPMFILNPTEQFVERIFKTFQDLETDKLSKEVYETGILSTSILLDKAYKHIRSQDYESDIDLKKKIESIETFLKNKLADFYKHLKYKPTYRLKIIYMAAIGNIQHDDTAKYLAPIVRGEDIFPVYVDIKKPEKYQIAAMWAIAKSINHNKELYYKTYWPIFSNKTLSQTVRLVAYELLVARNPMLDMNLLMNVHSFMTTETDKNIINYHYNTIKSQSKVNDPCMTSRTELMRKVLRLTKKHNAPTTMTSGSDLMDYYDVKYGHGTMLRLGIGVNEDSGFPNMGFYEESSSFARKRRLGSGTYWNVDGLNLNTISSMFKKYFQAYDYDVANVEKRFQINDEKVRNLLHQTRGHKSIEKNIHVELWQIKKGYVTNVQVYFENNLLPSLNEYVEKYIPKSIMDIGEKFGFTPLDITFSNIFKMIVPTDLGIPATFYNEVPELSYMKLKPNIQMVKATILTKLELEAKYYYQSHYKMEFYNPFADISQSISRYITTDSALPIEAIVSFNMETNNLKIVLPRTANSKFSIAGFKVEAEDQVSIANDYDNALKTYCSFCNNQTFIVNKNVGKVNYESITHSSDTGLEYAHIIHSCDNIHTSDETKEWFRIFNSMDDSDLVNLWPRFLLIAQQGLTNIMNVPYASSCKKMFKISPSTIYPTSRIEMNWRFNIEREANGVSLGTRGSVDVKATTANITRRYWDINANVNQSEFTYNYKFKFSRKTPEEKNLNICLEGQKIYPNILEHTNLIDQKTETRINFAIDNSYQDYCSYGDNNTLIKIMMQGELSNEQKKHFQSYINSGHCFKNTSNPLDFDITKRFDWNCLYAAVQDTTMRNYSMDVTYNNIPHELYTKFAMVENFLRHDTIPYLSYKSDHTEPGKVKIFINYNLYKNYHNITVVNPYFSYTLEDIPYGPEEDDRSNDIVLDNIGFSTKFLVDFYKGDTRPCIAHADEVINDLNQTIPMNFKEWTLMYGDHELMTYAVFVRAADEGRVAMKMFFNNHILTVTPGDSKPSIYLDDEFIDFDGNTINSPSWMKYLDIFKWKMVNDVLTMEYTRKNCSVKIYYTPYNLVVMPIIVVDRNVDGICGHMGSNSYIQDIPLIYKSS